MSEIIGLDPDELKKLENYSVKDWERFSQKMDPVTKQAVIIFASCDAEKRSVIASGIANAGDSGHGGMERLAYIASLSEESYTKIKNALKIE